MFAKRFYKYQNCPTVQSEVFDKAYYSFMSFFCKSTYAF